MTSKRVINWDTQYENLDSEEREQYDAIERGEIKPTKALKSITLRIAESELENIKAAAAREGLPYQTWIKSKIHQLLPV